MCVLISIRGRRVGAKRIFSLGASHGGKRKREGGRIWKEDSVSLSKSLRLGQGRNRMRASRVGEKENESVNHAHLRFLHIEGPAASSAQNFSITAACQYNANPTISGVKVA